MNQQNTVNEAEKKKFEAHQQDWWQPDGPLKTLHDINPARLSYIKNRIELHDKSILDVGCGGGILCEGMASMASLVTGIDVAESAIAIASSHAADSNLNIHYHCTPIESYENEPYDVITCLEMLEHVDNPVTVLTHCYRLLKAGGWLFLSTINRSAAAYAQVILAAEYILNILPRQTHDYQKFIKPSELCAMARHAGFEVMNISGLSYNPLSRQASVTKQPKANYLIACQKLAN